MAADLPPLLPPDLPVVDPDDDLRALQDLNLVNDEEVIVAEQPPPPVGRSWYFDFTASGFTTTGRGPVDTYGEITLQRWIEKTLRTARGAHPVYPSDYGMENPFEFIGRTLHPTDYGVLEGRVRDALTFHPRIVDVVDFVADQDPDDDVLVVTFLYIKDDGSATLMADVRLEVS